MGTTCCAQAGHEEEFIYPEDQLVASGRADQCKPDEPSEMGGTTGQEWMLRSEGQLHNGGQRNVPTWVPPSEKEWNERRIDRQLQSNVEDASSRKPHSVWE